jgi:uncharacterized membrane protein YgcG
VGCVLTVVQKATTAALCRFVWVYWALRRVCGDGTDIRTAQYVFGVLYIATAAVVFKIYERTRCPPWVLVILTLRSEPLGLQCVSALAALARHPSVSSDHRAVANLVFGDPTTKLFVAVQPSRAFHFRPSLV